MTRRSAFERELGQRLHAAAPPRAAEAERRAWHVVRAAHAARPPLQRRRRAARLAAAFAALVALGALALSPAGAKMGDWIDDVVSRAPEATRSSLTSLPVPGRLLVVADGSAWVVRDDGARDRLGAFRDATWSPGGLYVAAARSHDLVAVEPDGTERWTRPASGRVTVPRWSTDGYRVAYRSGSDLHVVTGDNADDWLLARSVAPVAPVWKPLPEPHEQVLAFAANGRVRIVEVDTGRGLGRTPPEPTPREIWWAGGRRLVTVTADSIRIHGPRGRLLRTVALPAGLEAVGSAMSPDGRQLALIAEPLRGRAASELLLMRIHGGQPRRLFSAPGSFEGLTWSIDGRLLVLGMPEADGWLYLRPGGEGGPRFVERIRGQFAGGEQPRRGTFPMPAGWCRPKPGNLTASGQPPCSAGAAR